MGTTIQTERLSTKELLINILSNVFFVIDLEAYINVSEKRRQLFCGNNLTLEKIKYNQNDSIDLNHLKRKGNRLAGNTKQLIDFRTIDRCFFVCVLLSIIMTTLTFFTSNNLFNALLISTPLVVLFFKCLNIELSTRKYVDILNHTRLDLDLIEKKLHERETITINILDITDVGKITRYDVVYSCISILKEKNIIDVLDNQVFNQPYIHTNILKSISQVQLARFLVYYIRENKIQINKNYTQKALVKCISENMQLENQAKLNTDSFSVTFNNVFKLKEKEYINQVKRYVAE